MRDIVPRDIGSYSYAETGYANPHAVTDVGGITHTYDNNGNVTAIGSLDYTWDWRNRLASAERTGGGNTTYGYDHTGQRVFRATGTATTSYPSMYFNLASTTGSATTTKHIFAPDGTLLATVEGSGVGTATTTYLHADHLGGTNVTTDEDGDVTQTLDYYPFGAERINQGSNSTDRHYIGERYDSAEDLNYLNARYYRGAQGQFLSQDPLFLAVGDPQRMKGMTNYLTQTLTDPQVLNSYSYARNNPIALKDPSGEAFVIPAYYGAIFLINGLLHLGIDLYDANTSVRQYPNQFGFGTKAGDAGEVASDLIFLGLGSGQAVTLSQEALIEALQTLQKVTGMAKEKYEQFLKSNGYSIQGTLFPRVVRTESARSGSGGGGSSFVPPPPGPPPPAPSSPPSSGGGGSGLSPVSRGLPPPPPPPPPPPRFR